ncbi:unnamed protein product, partial [Rhizoctonia solani]
MSEPIVKKAAGLPAAAPTTPGAAGIPTEENKKCKYKDFGHEEEKATHAKVDMAQIELKAENLYDKDKVDLETVVLNDVFTLLQCTEEGLTGAETHRRLELFGPNKLESKEQNAFLQFLGFMRNPLSGVMGGAALVAIALSNGGGRAPDWPDFVGIVLLHLINSAIGFYEECNAGNGVKAPTDSLAPKAKVHRDGKWSEIESAILGPFKISDVVPADCRLTESINVSIDRAALTGESLPQSKDAGDQCFSSSTCKQGEAEGVIISTGGNTFFGRTPSLVGQGDDTTGHLQKILAQIGFFCLVSIGIFIILEIVIPYPRFHYSYCHGLDSILVLLIGAIPLAIPTVLSITMAIGAQQLAKHKAIVTRITTIEELAGVTILCSDKTGTLTTNKLTIDK